MTDGKRDDSSKPDPTRKLGGRLATEEDLLRFYGPKKLLIGAPVQPDLHRVVLVEGDDGGGIASPNNPEKFILGTRKHTERKAMAARTCAHCGTALAPGARSHARFCGSSCRALASAAAKRLERDKAAAQALGLSLAKFRAARATTTTKEQR